MSKKIKTQPETPAIDDQINDDQTSSGVAKDISERLSQDEITEAKDETDAPKSKTSAPININALTEEQIQLLQERFASTPRRVKQKENYHTLELRSIGGKVIVEWGDSYFDLKHDTTLRRDVMKTMIPVRFHGEDKFVDILWYEEFMSADKVTCRVTNMEKKDVQEVVGTTLKRGKDGEETMQEVEMYVNKVIITLTVTLPDGQEATLDGKFAN